MREQAGPRVGREASLQAIPLLREEMLGERDDVLLALAERRELHREPGQAVVEVLAERSRPDELPQVAVRGADDAHVDAAPTRRTHRPDLACLESAEPPDLQRRRELRQAGPEPPP